ncbi:hypothetical protein WA026_018624 [Henosepilachna vigintioctopunctata]|uniref:Transcriptional regulator ATRX homolog n=1 Tax=Henosepilachna vigintioctopunctata TaxID=420089 RepID=A0AAW1UC64_9CUCU
MSDFDERLKDLLKYFTKISDVSKKAKDEISKYMKLDKSTESARKDTKKTLIRLTDNLIILIEEVTNFKKDSDLSKLVTDEQINEKPTQEDADTQNEKEITPGVSSEKQLSEENKENEKETTNVSDIKPLLKIVDFSKLVDPRNLELMDRNHKRKQKQKQNKISVIVLISSDEEGPTEAHSKNLKLKKDVSSHSNLDNKKESNNSKTSSQKPVNQAHKAKSNDPKDTEKSKSINSSTSTNSLKESVKDDNTNLILKNDKRFKEKAYVKLLRIPCEEMKEFYSTNREHNEKNVAISKLRKRNRSTASVLDEKTGELINPEVLSDGKKEPDEKKASKKNVLSGKISKQKALDKVTKKPDSSEKSDDSSEDIQSRFTTRIKKKKEDKPKKLNKKNKDNFEIKDNESENDVNSNNEENESNQNNQRDILNKTPELCDKEVSKNTIAEVEDNIVESNSDKISDTISRNKISLVLPVPLSDSESDYSTEENSNKSEKISQCVEKKKDSQDSESHGHEKSLGENRSHENTNLNNTLCEDIKEKSNEKPQSKSRKEVKDNGKASEKEEAEIHSSNVRRKKSKKEEQTKEKSQDESEEKRQDETVLDENISGEKKNCDKAGDEQNINCEEKRTKLKETTKKNDKKSASQSDEDMFDNESQNKNKDSSNKKKIKHSKGNSPHKMVSDSEEETTKELREDSSDKEAEHLKENRTNSDFHSDASVDCEQDESNKKESGVSSDSDIDIKKKRKRSENQSSENDVDHTSEDSEDFGAFYKKNKMLRSRQLKKNKMKGIISDSEEDAEQKKSENSGSECESKKSSEQSGNNSSSEIETKKTKSKKRRIIKNNEDSDSSDAKTTRKKIKKVISKNSLSESTKQANAEERERKQRIAEKQKKYNQVYENIDIASSKVDKLVLDIDEETNEPLLEVNKFLVSKLKPHQASGIQFMWDACFESLKRAQESTGSGCILAHCMGLGKTLQVIALVNTLIENSEKTKIRKVLVVTPLSTILNWKAEFKNWLSGKEDYDIYELVTCRPQNSERSFYINRWHKQGGVMIMSYSMFRNLSNDTNKKNKKFRDNFIQGLLDPGPDLVICDEGHLLKNEKTSISIAMNKIKTRRRIVLTGTPLQNNLKEYYCMVQFVKPNLLGTYKEYLNRFVNPITNGQYIDSTQYDINIMRRRSHVLHKLLDGIVQRRDYAILSPYLPPKFEYILFLTLTETQKKLYTHYLKHFSRKAKDDSSSRTSYLFQDFQAFSRICIHPRVLLDKSVDDQNKYQSDEESIGSLKNFIDDASDSTSKSDTSDSESGEDKDIQKKSKKKSKSKRVTRSQKSNENYVSDSEDEEAQKEWWQQYCDGDELDNLGNSTKLLVLFEILKECEQIGDKVLVFSQSLYALNAIEHFLEKVDEATQNGNADEKTCGFTGSWVPGLDYFRLDGSTNCNLRSNWCDAFNKEDNSRARLFLLSTKAGGLGINLVAANRVIIFDVSWNPSSDLQSIYRVYRFGQLKPSYIYRFVIYGTMEMKIYERQVTKQAISKRVIDEQQIDRHYNQNDLTELYKFDQADDEDRPTPLVPQDVLLAELLQHHEKSIFKYHEHQSLLANKEDETLNEEERKAAWEEFENEKVERTKQTLIGKFSVSTVQLALKSIIQKDNPTWNNSQILSIIPQLIQQLNIQLGAKDMTMYNRINAEVKLMQEEYTRKMQMQFYQYKMQMEAQRQQQLGFLGTQPNPFANYGNYQSLPRFIHNPGFIPSVPSSSTVNPSEIVELN